MGNVQLFSNDHEKKRIDRFLISIKFKYVLFFYFTHLKHEFTKNKNNSVTITAYVYRTTEKKCQNLCGTSLNVVEKLKTCTPNDSE